MGTVSMYCTGWVLYSTYGYYGSTHGYYIVTGYYRVLQAYAAEGMRRVRVRVRL